jgi:hypothetical protein
MNIKIKVPLVGFMEVLLVCCGILMTLLFLMDREGPQVVGVFIGLFFIFLVVWEYRGLCFWARGEGYKLVSMRCVLLGGLCYDIPPRSLMFRVVIRDSDGLDMQALVAFAQLDLLLRNPILCEIDEFYEARQAWSFLGELIFFGALNLYSIYLIGVGLSAWNNVSTHVLIRAFAISDEFPEFGVFCQT